MHTMSTRLDPVSVTHNINTGITVCGSTPIMPLTLLSDGSALIYSFKDSQVNHYNLQNGAKVSCTKLANVCKFIEVKIGGKAAIAVNAMR